MQMKVKHIADLPDGKAVRAIFDDCVSRWFREFGSQIGERHCLRVNPVRIFWSKVRTRYERTADLVLTDELGVPGQDKVLVKRAVEFTAEWSNAPQEEA